MSATPAEVEFFDIASNTSVTWSPNTAKTRMVLNYKRIPHKTTWLSYPDIAGTLESLGLPLSYTCPAIRHSGDVIMDSWRIALHLDRAFTGADSPSIFPTLGALPLAQLVHHHLYSKVLPAAMKLLLPKIPAILDDRGAEYFRRTRKEWFGKPLEELCEDPEGDWKRVGQEIAILSDMLSGHWSAPQGVVVERDGPFFLGAVPSYADFVLASFFQWCKYADERYLERVLAFGKEDCFTKLWNACENWVQVEH